MELEEGSAEQIGVWSRWPEVEAHYIDHVRKYLDGKCMLAARMYPERGSEIHASDLQGCPMLAYVQKTVEGAGELFPHSRETVLRFIRGIAVEDIMRAGKEKQLPCSIDGIRCSVDDRVVIEEIERIVEIKSTTMGLSSFDPLIRMPEWTERMGLYCKANGTHKIALVVFFIAGNMSDFLPWSKGRPEKFSSTDFRAYDIDFHDEFLEGNLELMNRRKKLLIEAIESNDPTCLEQELYRREEWMCRSCRMGNNCNYKLFPKKRKYPLTSEK